MFQWEGTPNALFLATNSFVTNVLLATLEVLQTPGHSILNESPKETIQNARFSWDLRKPKMVPDSYYTGTKNTGAGCFVDHFSLFLWVSSCGKVC